MIENYKNLVMAVILRTYEDLVSAYKKYYEYLANEHYRAAERCMSNIRYLEGWLEDASPDWMGKRLVAAAREKGKEEAGDE